MLVIFKSPITLFTEGQIYLIPLANPRALHYSYYNYSTIIVKSKIDEEGTFGLWGQICTNKLNWYLDIPKNFSHFETELLNHRRFYNQM